jgi:hypothetical protein
MLQMFLKVPVMFQHVEHFNFCRNLKNTYTEESNNNIIYILSLNVPTLTSKQGGRKNITFDLLKKIYCACFTPASGTFTPHTHRRAGRSHEIKIAPFCELFHDFFTLEHLEYFEHLGKCRNSRKALNDSPKFQEEALS